MVNLGNGMNSGTCCLSQAGLGIGSTASQVSIAAPNGAGVDYAINGIAYHKADAATAAITAATAQAALTSCLYLVTLNASGTLATVKGTDVTTADWQAGITPLEWPQPAEDTCPVGAFRIDTAAATTFTAGTTELSASGITDTYYNLFTVPGRPLAYS